MISFALKITTVENESLKRTSQHRFARHHGRLIRAITLVLIRDRHVRVWSILLDDSIRRPNTGFLLSLEIELPTLLRVFRGSTFKILPIEMDHRRGKPQT